MLGLLLYPLQDVRGGRARLDEAEFSGDWPPFIRARVPTVVSGGERGETQRQWVDRDEQRAREIFHVGDVINGLAQVFPSGLESVAGARLVPVQQGVVHGLAELFNRGEARVRRWFLWLIERQSHPVVYRFRIRLRGLAVMLLAGAAERAVSGVVVVPTRWSRCGVEGDFVGLSQGPKAIRVILGVRALEGLGVCAANRSLVAGRVYLESLPDAHACALILAS